MGEVGFHIPGNVPSSKNGKIKTRCGLISSKLTRDWIANTRGHFILHRAKFLEALKGKEKPYKIGFLFTRDSKRKFDYVNPLQTVQDQMVACGWLEDDNMEILLPVFEPYAYVKNRGGVRITVY